jgi:hypothetical protein
MFKGRKRVFKTGGCFLIWVEGCIHGRATRMRRGGWQGEEEEEVRSLRMCMSCHVRPGWKRETERQRKDMETLYYGVKLRMRQVGSD